MIIEKTKLVFYLKLFTSSLLIKWAKKGRGVIFKYEKLGENIPELSKIRFLFLLYL